MISYRFRLFSLVCAILLNHLTASAEIPPKREFRAAWVATVANLDWPTSPGGNPAAQRNQLTTLFDQLKSAGINAIIFQVRPECDALYASSIDPWSYWLTGQQGTAPSPMYDPLQFAIEEAHKRGMELHAWFNPYRAVKTVSGSGSYPVAQTHVSVRHPSWVITIGSFKFLDPGLPSVRDYVAGVIADVVRRYDIDGVHFDDYFYPYPPNQITNQDNATFATFPRGFTNQSDWRRDNVNLLVKMVHDSIQALKPFVRFGISPFGIWKNGVPSGISGMDAYSSIYCDAMGWLGQQTIDYLTPQLYWAIGGSQDYSKLMPWWADSIRAHGRHLYPGHASYRINDNNWGSSELPNQLRLNRTNGGAPGSVFFRALQGVVNNPKGFADSLRSNFYLSPSLSPSMAWKDSIPPYMPRGIRYAPLASGSRPVIQWDLPLVASDGDTAWKYVIYRFDHQPSSSNEFSDPRNIVAIEPGRMSNPPIPTGAGPYFYYATALDRNSNESDTSLRLLINRPVPPALVFPADGGGALPGTVTFRWSAGSMIAGYRIQVSTDSTFANGFLANVTGLADTFTTVTNLQGQRRYFWRVGANNIGGTGDFSQTRSFTVGVPAAPIPVLPANYATDVPVDVRIIWRSVGATAYRIQLSALLDFSFLTIDTTGIIDTSFTLSRLPTTQLYYWRVMGSNAIGGGSWSEIWRFKTAVTGIAAQPEVPVSFELSQNYPNPFNPSTTIQYSVPRIVRVTIKIYDVLGSDIATLVDDMHAPGRYVVTWNAAENRNVLRSGVASGVYFYRIVAGGFVATKRMLFIK